MFCDIWGIWDAHENSLVFSGYSEAGCCRMGSLTSVIVKLDILENNRGNELSLFLEIFLYQASLAFFTWRSDSQTSCKEILTPLIKKLFQKCSKHILTTYMYIQYFDHILLPLPFLVPSALIPQLFFMWYWKLKSEPHIC